MPLIDIIAGIKMTEKHVYAKYKQSLTVEGMVVVLDE